MDYEKKYKEALEKAKNTIEVNQTIPDIVECVESLFPELKESEDERIRKAIIATIHLYYGEPLEDEAKEMIAWLEKQGEQPKKVSIWKHWKDGIAGNGEGKLIYLIKNGNNYSLSSNLGFECDYIELSELDNLLLEKKGEDNKKEYSVWVGGGEINDYTLSKEEAEKLAEEYKKDGYDDVIVEKQGEQKPDTDFSNIRIWKYIVDEVLTEKEGIGQYLDSPFTEEVAKKLQKRFGNIEQRPTFEMKTPEESLGIDSDTYNKIVDECVYGEQKPTDKVEPKFHEGDWITNGDYTWQIVNVTDLDYILLSQDGHIVPYSIPHADEQFHSFTIQDAKDGDVLSWDDSKCIALFKNIYDEGSFNSYGFVGHCTGTFELRLSYHDIEGAHPATKEQRDLLFKKMKEAGYEWDFEKKELKKIEQTSADETPYPETLEKAIDLYYYSYGNGKGEFEHLSLERFRDIVHTFVSDYGQKPWSEEDEKFVHGLIRGLAAKKDIHGHTTFSSDCIDITKTINWLEFLKYRVQPQTAWWNEDDGDLYTIANNFMPEPVWNALEESKGEGSNAAAYDYSQMIAMFKAGVQWLKSQSHWKPSDEQIKVIKWIIDGDNPENWSITLESLYQDLQKLKA